MEAQQLWRTNALARCLAALKRGARQAREARTVTAQLQQALDVSRQRAILAKMRREHCTVAFDVWWHYWAEQRWLKLREQRVATHMQRVTLSSAFMWWYGVMHMTSV